MALSARLQRGEIRTRVGLGEDRSRNDLTGSNTRQVLFFLLGCAVRQDQLAGDFRSRAKGANANVAA